MSKAYIRKIVLLAAIILCCSLCVGRSAVNAMSRTETPDLTEDVYSGANVPVFTGGTEIGSFTGSGTTRTVKYDDTTFSDFSAYKSELVSKGFTIYDENTVDGNYFATLTKDFVTVTLSWFRTGIMQIICERKGDLCPLSDLCKKVCDTLITGFEGQTVVASEGMGYIIRLQDGSFCIIDGGMGDPDHIDSNNLMDILMRQKPDSHEKPVIAAWIFTHLHGDHIGVFNCFSLDHHDEVVIERLIYNFPTAVQIAASDSPYMLDESIYRYTQFRKNLKDFYSDVPVLKIHGGNRFQVRNAAFEVLYEQEDLLPKTILDGGGMNESSMLLKMTLEGQTVLWTGDFAFLSEELVLSEYDSALACDILQMAHHGINGSAAFYSKVDPTYALLPAWKGAQSYIMDYTQNQWLVNSPKLRQIINTANGTWTIKMPYSPVDGTYERIPSESMVHPSYPDLLGGDKLTDPEAEKDPEDTEEAIPGAPPTPLIKKILKGRRSFTVKWKKQADTVSGYQIQYSLKKNFRSRKTITIKKRNVYSKRIKNLKARKRYYIRIRTFVTAGGVTARSKWSPAMSVKTR